MCSSDLAASPAPAPFAAQQVTPQPPPPPPRYPQRPGGQPGYQHGPQPAYQGQPDYNPGPHPGYPPPGYPQGQRPGYPQPGHPGYPQGQPGYPQGRPGYGQPPYQGQPPGYPQAAYQGQPGYGQPGQQGQPGYGQYPYQQAYAGTAARPEKRKKSGLKRVLVSFIVLAVLLMAGAAAYLVLKPDLSRFGIGTPQAQPGATGTQVTPSALGAQPRVVLTSEEVKGGDTYSVTASGFSPGETVQLTWTGPTQGTMGSGPADAGGVHSVGPIVERDPPGSYEIIATGLKSGLTAKTPLEVVAAEAPDN